jgi:transcription factor E
MHSKSILNILREIGITIDHDSQKILDILDKKAIINENDIADELGMRVNDVRKALYKWGNYGFVNYTKEKDIEKKWWYVYNWQLDKAKIHYKYIQHLRAILHKKEHDLLSEQKYAFQCNKCKRKYAYDSALDLGFYCDTCSGVLKEVRNTRLISQLSKEIAELLIHIRDEEEIARKDLEAQMKARQELLDKEKAAEEAAKLAQKEARKKERAEKRAAEKKAAEKLKPKTAKKPAKKVVKKPSKKIVKKSAKKSTKKPAKKVVKKPSKKIVKKSAKKPANKKPTKKRR